LTREEIGEGWTSRLQSEAALWSELIGKLASVRSAPDCVAAYSDCLSQRLQTAEDDSPRVVEKARPGANHSSRPRKRKSG
jgi:hypothetical protein